MAELIAKIGLDATDLVNGLNNATKSTQGISTALGNSAQSAQALSNGFKGASSEAANLDKNVKSTEASLSKVGGAGGGAIDGLKSKFASLGSTLQDVGKTALGVFGGGLLVGGVQSLIGGFDDLIKKGLSVKQAQNEIKAAFGGSGIAADQLDSVVKSNAKNVEKLSYTYAVSKGSINEATNAFLNFGGKSKDLAKTQEQLIVLQQRYGLSSEAAGKLLGKATDPENEASLKKIGIVFDKNATEAERQEKIQKKLAESMNILKEQANGPVGSINRFQNALAGIKGAIATSLIDTLAPIMEQLSIAAKFVIDNVLPQLKNGIAAIKEFLAPLGEFIKGTLQNVANAALPILIGAFNLLKNAISGVIDFGKNIINQFGGIQNILNTLAPYIYTITAAFVGYQLAVNAGAAATFLANTASSAYAAIQGVLSGGLGLAATAQTLLNAAMALNPIGLVVAAIAGLVAGFVVLYNKSETFRNLIKDLWEWVKKIGLQFIDFVTRFSPITGIFRLAYDNIKPFRDAVDALIGQVLKLWDGVKNLASSIGDLFSSGSESKPPEQKKQEQTSSAVAVGAETTKDSKDKEKDKKKDITDQIRAQQDAIASIKREADEAAIKDENARAIRNLQNQYADKIAKVKEGNKKVQDADDIAAGQKRKFQELSNEQIIALEEDLNSKLNALREKQREKSAEDAKKAFDAFQSEAKKRSDAARKEEEELQKMRDEAIDEAEQARQDLAEQRRKREEDATKKAEARKQEVIKAFNDAVDDIRKKSAEKAVTAAKNIEALNAEEKALYASLRKREISYEEFNIKIAELERKRAALQAGVQTGANTTFKTEMGALVAGIRASIGQSLTNMRADFDFEFSEARKKGELNLQALGGSAATLFGSLVANGSSAIDALKQSLSQTLGALIEVYVAPIIASTLSFLGPFALPVALATVQGLKSLLNSALAGFQDGGYTGDRGESSVAGVVHGQEFVHTASVTRKNRALFEYLHKGGELSNWAVSAAGNLQQPVSIAAPMVNTYGIESRLDRLETAIVKSSKRFDSMRAVQMTVEHDPTLTIKAQSRNLQVRNARV